MVPFICNFRGENNKAPRFYLGALNLFILRREQDSNLRTGFAGYTLSRRASSTTRAPLLFQCGCKGTNKRANNQIYLSFFNREYFPLHFFAFPI